MSVIHVDFNTRNKKKNLQFEDLMSLVHSLISQGEVILAETTISKQLNIPQDAAKALLVAIVIDSLKNSNTNI